MEKFVIYKDKDNLDAVLKELTTKVQKALALVGAEARTRASENAPRRTGLLARSYGFAVSEDEDAVYVGAMNSVFRDDGKEPYAAYVELGTSRQKAQPHLEPAIMDNIDVYKNIIEKTLRE